MSFKHAVKNQLSIVRAPRSNPPPVQHVRSRRFWCIQASSLAAIGQRSCESQAGRKDTLSNLRSEGLSLLWKYYQQRRVLNRCFDWVVHWARHRLPSFLRDLQIFYHTDSDHFCGIRGSLLLSDHQRLWRTLLLLFRLCHH